ncbi:MAG: NAD(P)-dependent alcohol dehydrogenase [Thermoleophilia bacterium]|nr:NAD(P)-dependent alcohol dehydrogenase [Thermoleophilia bacterium]
MSTESVVGYAAKAPGGPLEAFTYEAPALGDHDVRVKVSHCGVCYSDVHAIDSRYGVFAFPMVPGHEIVGEVSEMGSAVSGLKVGDRVGIGWQGRSCMRCEWCLKGEEQLCPDVRQNGTWTPYGGFASSVTVDGRFAYPLPEGMPSDVAAVLMCAGAAVYSPLRAYAGEDSPRVGIVGVGGLGHLAIQFAHAMGCQVTAISSSPEKEREALDFGADHFIVSADKTALRQAESTFDLLLCSAHSGIDWDYLASVLKRRGRLVLLGFPQVDLDSVDLVVHELSITGSFLGSRARMREMLAFAQEHRILPKVELMPMSQANEAIQRVRDNRARYRIVLVNDMQS